jgi:hypothetical protein
VPKKWSSRAIRVLLVTRKQVTSSRTKEISARAFANPDAVISGLTSKLKTSDWKYQLIVADFADLAFDHQVSCIRSPAITMPSLRMVSLMQVALTNSIDILVGFHGAGMNHFFHMNYTRSSCCGVIELFPQASGCDRTNGMVCTYHKRKAHGNHARYLGYEYIDITVCFQLFRLETSLIVCCVGQGWLPDEQWERGISGRYIHKHCQYH